MSGHQPIREITVVHTQPIPKTTMKEQQGPGRKHEGREARGTKQRTGGRQDDDINREGGRKQGRRKTTNREHRVEQPKTGETKREDRAKQPTTKK